MKTEKQNNGDASHLFENPIIMKNPLYTLKIQKLLDSFKELRSVRKENRDGNLSKKAKDVKCQGECYKDLSSVSVDMKDLRKCQHLLHNVSGRNIKKNVFSTPLIKVPLFDNL